MDQWGIGIGGPQTMPHPAPDPGLFQPAGGLTHGTVRILPELHLEPVGRRSRIESGGQIGEIIDMCAPIRERQQSGEDAGTTRVPAEWVAMADKLIELAAEDEARGRDLLRRRQAAAGGALPAHGRAHAGPRRTRVARRPTRARRTLFDNAARLGHENVRTGRDSAGERHDARAATSRAAAKARKPVVVYCNGLDSCKELLYWSRLRQALARRGISTLCVDQPGTGEALRLQGLPATPHSERWASKAVDWLEQQPDVDPTRIGMTGISLGGHFAPRAVAFEPRFAQRRRLGREPQLGRGAAEAHAPRRREPRAALLGACVCGCSARSDMDEFLAKSTDMHLNGVMDRSACRSW